MDRISLPASITGIYSRISDNTLRAAESAEISIDKPQFAIKLLLAVLDKPNRNGHYLSTAEAQKALDILGDRPFIPGNCNHDSMISATSTKLWIEDNKLYLEGVFWTRALPDNMFTRIMDEFQQGKLGASWEIDRYRLEIEGDIKRVCDFTIDGWALMVGMEPAEELTKGNVVLSASVGEDGELDSKPLTYQERQELPDEDFALIRYVVGEDGEKRKERHFPIDSEERRRVVLTFLKKALPENFTEEEKIKIFKKALSRGRREGDSWVEKYDDWNVDVWPPRPKSEASHAMAIYDINSSELFNVVRSISCPICNSAIVGIKSFDLETSEFEMECYNTKSGDDECHKYIISLAIRPVVANDVTRTKEMSDMTEEEVQLRVATAVTEAIKGKEQEIADAVKKALEDYMAKLDTGVERAKLIAENRPLGDIGEIFNTILKYGEMVQEAFDMELKDAIIAKKDREIMELQAKLVAVPGSVSSLPSGINMRDARAEESAPVPLSAFNI